MAMRQVQATFMVGSQLATDQRGYLRQGNRDQPARGHGTGIGQHGLGERHWPARGIGQREELAGVGLGKGVG